MGRKTLEYTIDTDGGRDAGKKYILTEMPATQIEKWAARAFLALSKSGVEVPEDVAESGVAGLAAFGLKGLAGLNYEDAEPLMDEMMSCVQIQPDIKHPQVVRRLNEDDIEEVATRIRLRAAIFKLHANFSRPDAPSMSPSGSMTTEGTGRIGMSRGRSAQ